MGVIWQKKWITGRVRKPNPELVQNKLKSPQKYQNWKMSHDLETPQMVFFWTRAPQMEFKLETKPTSDTTIGK